MDLGKSFNHTNIYENEIKKILKAFFQSLFEYNYKEIVMYIDKELHVVTNGESYNILRKEFLQRDSNKLDPVKTLAHHFAQKTGSYNDKILYNVFFLNDIESYIDDAEDAHLLEFYYGDCYDTMTIVLKQINGKFYVLKIIDNLSTA